MPAGLFTEKQVPKRKPTPPEDQAPDELIGRIELKAPVEWIAKLDAAAEAVGLSRSAYIRLACNKLIDSDKRQRAD